MRPRLIVVWQRDFLNALLTQLRKPLQERQENTQGIVGSKGTRRV